MWQDADHFRQRYLRGNFNWYKLISCDGSSCSIEQELTVRVAFYSSWFNTTSLLCNHLKFGLSSEVKDSCCCGLETCWCSTVAISNRDCNRNADMALKK